MGEVLTRYDWWHLEENRRYSFSLLFTPTLSVCLSPPRAFSFSLSAHFLPPLSLSPCALKKGHVSTQKGSYLQAKKRSNPAMLAPWSLSLELRENVCCWSHPVHSALLWACKLANTSSYLKHSLIQPQLPLLSGCRIQQDGVCQNAL